LHYGLGAAYDGIADGWLEPRTARFSRCGGLRAPRTTTPKSPPKEVTVSALRPALSGPIPLPAGFVARTITRGQGTRSLCCPNCSAPLNLLQPDEGEPSRLLGTCEACAKWFFLVELDPEWKKTLLVELPNSEAIRQELGGSEAPRPGRQVP
jgi:hypothetical protein